jgi:hypothetical protein
LSPPPPIHGALLLGHPTVPSADRNREIEFVGAVGTGWTVATARRLLQQLDKTLDDL